MRPTGGPARVFGHDLAARPGCGAAPARRRLPAPERRRQADRTRELHPPRPSLRPARRRCCASARRRWPSGSASSERARDRVETLSGGLQRRAELARRCCTSPAAAARRARTGLDPARGATSCRYLRAAARARRRDRRADHALHGRGRALRPRRHPAPGQAGAASAPPESSRAASAATWWSSDRVEPRALQAKIRERFGCEVARGRRHVARRAAARPRVRARRGRGVSRRRDARSPSASRRLEDVFIHLTGHRFWGTEQRGGSGMSEVRSEGAVWPAIDDATASPRRACQWGAVRSLWWREIVRFVRQRSRVTGRLRAAAGVLAVARRRAQRLVPAAGHAGDGQLHGVLLSRHHRPGAAVHRDLRHHLDGGRSARGLSARRAGGAGAALASIVLGQALGGTTLAVVQGATFLLLRAAGGHPRARSGRRRRHAASRTLVAFGADQPRSDHRLAHGIDAGVPRHHEPDPDADLVALRRLLPGQRGEPLAGYDGVNPLTYGMAALRRCLYLGDPSAAAGLPALLPSVVDAGGVRRAQFLGGGPHGAPRRGLRARTRPGLRAGPTASAGGRAGGLRRLLTFLRPYASRVLPLHVGGCDSSSTHTKWAPQCRQMASR